MLSTMASLYMVVFCVLVFQLEFTRGITLDIPMDVYCNFTGDPTEPAMPELDSKFTLKFLLNEEANNSIVYVTEEYDYEKNRASVDVMSFMTEGTFEDYRQIYDFEFEQVFDIYKNGTCKTLGFDEAKGIKLWFQSKLHHVQKPSDYFYFATLGEKVYYLGKTTMRNTSVEHWATCAADNTTHFRSDFYFAPGLSRFSRTTNEIYRPIMMFMNGINKKDNSPFKITYDYDLYYPGSDLHTESSFEIGRNSFCPDKETNLTMKPMPELFSSIIELRTPKQHVVGYMKELYDHKNKLHRIDIAIPRVYQVGESYGKKFGFERPLTIVHDYNEGVEYVIDGLNRNCTASTINVTLVDDGEEIGKNWYQMMNTSQLLYMDTIKYTYQGMRDFDFYPCNVWSGFHHNYPSGNYTTRIDVYYLQEPWRHATNTSRDKKIVGVEMIVFDKKTNDIISEKKITLLPLSYEFPNVNKFNAIQKCYEGQDERESVFVKLLASYKDYIPKFESVLAPAVKNALAKMAGVEPLRILSIGFTDSNDTEIDIWFTVLSRQSFQGNAAKQNDYVDLEQALKNLRDVINNYKRHVVIGGKKIYFKQNYMFTMTEILTKNFPPKPNGYSSGAMAGLAVGMLALGALIACALTILFFKRQHFTGSSVVYHAGLSTEDE